MSEIDQKELPDSVSELKTILHSITEKDQKNLKTIETLENENESLEIKNKLLIEELRLLRLKHYARISERFELDKEDIQRSLFPELIMKDAALEFKDTDYKIVPEHKRKKPGRKKLPEDLKRVDIIHDIPEKEKQCCGEDKNIIGYETSEKLRIEPAILTVEVHKRPKYGCGVCEGLESDGKTISIAPMPLSMIPKSISTPSLLAHIFVSKFCDALPFYRQEKQFKRYGVDLTRATMVNWALKVGSILKPLLTVLRLYVLSGPLINMDETTVQVIKEPGRKAKSKSYSWVLRGGLSDIPGFIYHYAPSRSTAVAKELLKDYKGFVQTDGFASYNFLNNHTDIEHFGCWAHVRRKFNDVLKVSGQKSKGLASDAMTMIRELYKIEKKVKENQLAEESIYQVRQKLSKPIVEKFGLWLKENDGQIPDQSLLGKAFTYTLGQWPLLIKYLDNGIVRMDNNLAENAIRPFVIGRKNWMFSMTPEGAETTALFYSLIETAKANGLDPYKYLKYIFEEFPTVEKTPEAMFMLLPMNNDDIKLRNNE